MALFVVAAGFGAGSSSSSSPDPIAEKLDRAKEKFRQAVATYRQSVSEHLNAREEAARRKGDKAAVDAVKTDRTLFEEAGRVPETLPRRVRDELERAHKAVTGACAQAVKDYTRTRQDARAAAADKELKQLTSDGPVAAAARAGSAARRAAAAAAPQVVRVNLLREVKLTAGDLRRGPWAWENDALKSGGQADQWCQVQYAPPAEYDLDVEFTRLEGNDIVALIFPVGGGRDTLLYLGGYANKVMGLDSVDGVADGRNPTNTRPPGGCLANGHRYALKVEVRRDAVRALLDGDRFVSIDPRNKRFGVAAHWGARPGLIGVGSYRSPTYFHAITVTEHPTPAPAAAAAHQP